MGENIDKMKLCLISETGEEIELSGIPELTLDANDIETTNSKELNLHPNSCEFSLNIKPRSHVRLWLALIGFSIANNWRKMHGGVMDRRGVYRNESNRTT